MLEPLSLAEDSLGRLIIAQYGKEVVLYVLPINVLRLLSLLLLHQMMAVGSARLFRTYLRHSLTPVRQLSVSIQKCTMLRLQDMRSL